MNATFSFKRVGLLLKRFFIENINREIMFWCILTALFTLLHQGDFVKLILYITGFVFAARQFKVFLYRPGSMHYLLIPATHVEKLTASILLNTVYFFCMTILTYAIGNLLGTNLFNSILGTSNPVSWDLFYTRAIQTTEYNNLTYTNNFWGILGFFTICQAVCMLGSLYFKRNALGKTLVSIMLLGIVLAIIESILFKLLFSSLFQTNNMVSINIILSESTLPSEIELAIKIGTFLLIPFLWLVSYFRLAEKQV